MFKECLCCLDTTLSGKVALLGKTPRKKIVNAPSDLPQPLKGPFTYDVSHQENFGFWMTSGGGGGGGEKVGV